MHISGQNSYPFYLSKILGWQVRNLRLCHELYNKKGKEIVITFGDPIMPNEMEQFNDKTMQLGEFLKGRTYDLGKNKEILIFELLNRTISLSNEQWTSLLGLCRAKKSLKEIV